MLLYDACVAVWFNMGLCVCCDVWFDGALLRLSVFVCARVCVRCIYVLLRFVCA